MLNKYYYIIIPLILLLLYLIACSQKSVKSPTIGEKPAITEKPAIKEGWEAKWDRVKEEAKREGTINLYSNLNYNSRQVIAEGLKEYGIKLEAVTGRGAEIAIKISRERKAGIYAVDLYLSAFGDIQQLQPLEAFASLEPLLILPEVKDPKVWYKGELPFTPKDKKDQTVLAYSAYITGAIQINTDLVKPRDINSSEDLLFPKWKGKMIIDDPTNPGQGNQKMVIAALVKGEEYLKQLAKQDIIITRDRRQLADWLAKGKVAIALGINSDIYNEFKGAGASIDNVLLRDALYLTAGGDYITYLDRAPHPNASRVFLNWLLSKKVQIIWENFKATQSARIDTPAEERKKMGLPIRQPGDSYIDTIGEEWYLEGYPKGNKIVQEIFGPVVK